MKFRNPFATKKVLPPSEPDSQFIPIEIEDNSSDFFEALGITEKRRKEIIAAALSRYTVEDNLVSAISTAAKSIEVNHANELTALVFTISRQHINSAIQGDLISSLLSGGRDKSED